MQSELRGLWSPVSGSCQGLGEICLLLLALVLVVLVSGDRVSGAVTHASGHLHQLSFRVEPGASKSWAGDCKRSYG